jgi:predicted PurR-regulated permease PerM
VNLPPRISMGDMARGSRIYALRRDLRIIKICVIGLLAIAALTGGVAAGAVLAPTAIAVILALVLAPIAQALERLGMIPGLAALITVLALSSVLVVGTAALAPSFRHWINDAPQLVHSVELKLRPFRKQIAAVESASTKLSTAVTPSKTLPPPAPPSIITTVFTNAPGVAASVLYVAVLTIFLLSERRRYAAQLILLPRTFRNRLRMARICRDVRSRVSGYLFTLASINVGLAIATAVCFTIAGISEPLLWGVAYGILNFLPIIGPTAIIVTAAAVGFVTADTISGAILPPAILLGLDVVEAYFVQPWLLSRRLVISPIAIFVMVAVLVWMWGAAGVVTAVPMLILIHTVMLHVPNLRAYARFLATERWRPRQFAVPRNSVKVRPFS